MFSFLRIEITAESGIYQNWMSYYSGRKEIASKPLAEYETGELKDFVGLFALCGWLLAFALLILCFEFLIHFLTTILN